MDASIVLLVMMMMVSEQARPVLCSMRGTWHYLFDLIRWICSVCRAFPSCPGPDTPRPL